MDTNIGDKAGILISFALEHWNYLSINQKL